MTNSSSKPPAAQVAKAAGDKSSQWHRAGGLKSPPRLPKPSEAKRCLSARSRPCCHDEPTSQQVLQKISNEIIQRLHAARGQNRRQHPFLTSTVTTRATTPVMGLTGHTGCAGIEALPVRPLEAVSPVSTRPHTSAEGEVIDTGDWRRRLRLRNTTWRMPERPSSRAGTYASGRSSPNSLVPQAPAGEARVCSRFQARQAFASERKANQRNAASARSASPPSGRDVVPKARAWTPRRPVLKDLEGNYKLEVEKKQGRKLAKRMNTIYRRYFAVSSKEDSDMEEEADQNIDLQMLEDPATRGQERTAPDTHLGILETEIYVKEVGVKFQVVKCSTQRPESPAKDLQLHGAWWETQVGCVEDQWVVLELADKEPRRVQGLEMTLPGTDTGPRRCRLYSSTTSSDGPWKEAWSFEIPRKSDPVVRTTFESGSNKVKDFKEWLTKSFRSGPTEACRKIFDGKETGITFMDFSSAIGRCKQSMIRSDTPLPQWTDEAAELFEEIDTMNLEEVSFMDIWATPAEGPPEAAWWKLVIFENWGNAKRLQVMSPLSLWTLMQVQTSGASTVRGTLQGQREANLHESDLLMAFDIKILGVSAETVQLRRLAKKYNINNVDIEDMHKMFMMGDTGGGDDGGDGIIDQEEFRTLLLRLHGTDDPSDLPQERIRFFWQQADQDGNGGIDFEEYIQWYSRYAKDIALRKKPARVHKVLASAAEGKPDTEEKS